LFNLFKYKTPEKYAHEFKRTYSHINIKQVKFLSSLILVVATMIRLSSFFFLDEVKAAHNYHEYSYINWIEIFGSLVFFLISTKALKSKKWTSKSRSILTLSFVLFIIAFTYSTSYIISLHNTKNTLTMFLVGVVAVSIFFLLELWEILLASMFVIFLFATGLYLSNLGLQQNLFSCIISVVLAFVLFSFSRYSYYFKSQHFLQLKELEEKNREVERLNHQKSEILGFVAHDLRNPLNNIEALSTMMLMEDHIQDTVKTEVTMVLNSARQAKTIIYDLLEVIEASNKDTSIVTQKTNLTEFIADICSNWTLNLAGERIINFHSWDHDLLVLVNRSKFLRVIDNLVGNAIKFSGPDQPIEVSVEPGKDHLALIKIKDYGIGVPSALKDQLFDQFSKAGRPGLKGEKSIGLGLHICKNIIEQHRGSISVISQENKGSCFIIELPPYH
jgi:signal transduction histidine kinase